ncbi:heterokaryon incompatibility protein-domain-containing protein [Phaeosphaeria sp. MPI-PUGE-AT-0046c]|nr:heterokaryon incompatibility protein-domain-containing protein [Phaeosphaeria sp. MPI-PUGE-AT-0046c]
MRLLQRHGDSSFRLIKVDRHIPPYAILSHTWGTEDDEVTFHDIVDGSGPRKAGYRKINFCAKQAASEGFDFFWIDTCCIDKSSSSELSEAINSMFRWYRDSAKCYALLDDVFVEGPEEVDKELAFQKSRWFTRGWTLQELLAPKSVDFFSAEGYPIGSKSSRAQEIAKITGIPIEALQEKDLSFFSIDQRMMWAKGRETTREEDMAYCLMGLFDIFMASIYGEGEEHAFMRLHKKLRSYREAHQSKGGEDIALRSNYLGFALQTPTMLHETNEQFSLLMAGSRKDVPPDMIAVKRTGTTDENIELNILYGGSNYQSFVLRVATPNFTPLRKDWSDQLDFILTDWNGDGTQDLVVIKKHYTGSSSTEVHIFSGASRFQGIMLQVGTALEETDNTWTFGMGRWLGGEKPDLYAIKKSNTGTRTTEVRVLSGDMNFQQIILKTDTGLHETGPEFDFVVADWNGDGLPDLVAVKKSKTTDRYIEVHVLSGASKYKDFILRAETPMKGGNCLFDFAVADWTGNGRADLITFKKSGTGANSTELHVMSQYG